MKNRSPLGRTGVRGRGALIRWGPNKTIMAIITRWKKLRGQFVIVDGQKILEAMVFKDKISGEFKLPGVSFYFNITHIVVNITLTTKTFDYVYV